MSETTKKSDEKTIEEAPVKVPFYSPDLGRSVDASSHEEAEDIVSKELTKKAKKAKEDK